MEDSSMIASTPSNPTDTIVNPMGSIALWRVEAARRMWPNGVIDGVDPLLLPNQPKGISQLARALRPPMKTNDTVRTGISRTDLALYDPLRLACVRMQLYRALPTGAVRVFYDVQLLTDLFAQRDPRGGGRFAAIANLRLWNGAPLLELTPGWENAAPYVRFMKNPDQSPTPALGAITLFVEVTIYNDRVLSGVKGCTTLIGVYRMEEEGVLIHKAPGAKGSIITSRDGTRAWHWHETPRAIHPDLQPVNTTTGLYGCLKMGHGACYHRVWRKNPLPIPGETLGC